MEVQHRYVLSDVAGSYFLTSTGVFCDAAGAPDCTSLLTFRNADEARATCRLLRKLGWHLRVQTMERHPAGDRRRGRMGRGRVSANPPQEGSAERRSGNGMAQDYPMPRTRHSAAPEPRSGNLRIRC